MNIAKVYDANVYVNNASKHGLASEITAPTITALMTDYKAMGMIGSAEFFNGFDNSKRRSNGRTRTTTHRRRSGISSNPWI